MRTRLRLAAKIALVLTLVAPIAIAQNAPNTQGGRNNGGGGPGGGGGGPGGGGWGGPGGGGPGGGGNGTSPAALVLMPVVQDELKMTDKQKDQIKQTNEDAEKKRVQVREKANKMAAAAREQAAIEAAAAAEANGGTPYNANGNGNGNNGGGRGGRGNRNDPGAQVQRQVMDDFQTQVEASLLKVLDTKQKTRIKQIALQAEGAGAFDNADVIEKLGLTEEQVDIIQSIRDGSRQSSRDLMGQIFNNGGPGGPGGGRPDPATFQTPEFQAKLKGVQESQQKLDDQTMSSVGKALSKAQRATFQKMVGEKFDVSQVRRSFADRFRPAGTPAPPPTATASTATPAPATPAAAAPAATAAAAPAATTAASKAPAKKSLRELRSGGNQP